MDANTSSPIDFVSITDSWKLLEQFFSRIERLPKGVEDFAARYGQFDDPQAIASLLAILSHLDDLKLRLGGPSTLERRLLGDPFFLQGSMPDADCYSGVCWLCSRCGQTASAVANVYQEFRPMLNSGTGAAGDKAGLVKEALVGQAGLVPSAVAIKASSLGLTSTLTAISSDFNKAYAVFNKTLILNMSNLVLGGLRSKIGTLEPRVAKALEKAASSWIGKEKAQREYQALSLELDALRTEQSNKQQLVSDFDGLFSLGNKAVNALLAVIDCINKCGDIFAGLRSLWMTTTRAATVDQLSSYDWLEQALGLPNAITRMNAVNASAHSFMERMLISQ